MLIDGITTPSGVQLDTAELDKVDSVAAGNTQEQLDAKLDAAPTGILDIRSSAAPALRISRDGTAGQIASLVFEDGAGTVGTASTARIVSAGGKLEFGTGGVAGALATTERMTIDATGKVQIGTTSAIDGALLTADAGTGTVSAAFRGNTSAGLLIRHPNTNRVDFTTTNSSHHISFSINTVERLRIENTGTVRTNATTVAAVNALAFNNPNGQVGRIQTNNSTTSYVTSSDYRLKENVLEITDGIDRVKLLKPSKFNFITEPGVVFDGFLAHEAQAIVPECVVGTKDEVDENLDPVMQGIDQSKLVPLLTAALKEEIAKREALEVRILALESV